MKNLTPVTTKVVNNMNVIFDAEGAAIGEMVNTDLANIVVSALNNNADLKNQIKDNAIMHVREIDALRNPWISVDDRLPEMLRSVLISITNDMTDEHVSEAIHQMDGEFLLSAELATRRVNARACVGVTHWMPLPEHQKPNN